MSVFSTGNPIFMNPDTNLLSKIKYVEEGNHILFADIEDRLGTLPMRWSVPAAMAAFRPSLAV